MVAKASVNDRKKRWFLTLWAKRNISLNRLYRRKRGMASNPLFTIPDFCLHFPNELCYGYLRFEENWKIPFGRQGKKVCPVGCLCLAKLNWDKQLGKLFSLPYQRNFTISFKPKVAIASSFGKCKKKSGIMKIGLDAMPLFLLYDLLIIVRLFLDHSCSIFRGLKLYSHFQYFISWLPTDVSWCYFEICKIDSTEDRATAV